MAKDDFTNGVWRTVGGRRIFIRDGQSLSDAMKSSGKFGKSKKDKKLKEDAKRLDEMSEKNKQKENKQFDKDLEKYNQLSQEERIDKYLSGKKWNDWSDEELKDEMYHNTNMLNEMERRLSSKYNLSDEQKEKLEDRAANYESRRDELKSELESRKNGKGEKELSKQQGVQKLKDRLNSNKEQDEVTTVRSQMSELEEASGSKVKDAFQTDLFGNGKENRFILEDGTIVGHTLESFGEKTDDWYVGDRHFKNYDEVKDYLSGGSKKGGDEFEDLSKELKEISSRTGKSDLMSEAGQRWNELYKKDRNNVGRDLGDGYRMSVGYDGGVQISSSHPYDETNYSWAHKKDNGEWVVHNPIKGEYSTKTFSNREDALKEMKSIDKHLTSGNRTTSYEGTHKYDSPKGVRRDDGGFAEDDSVRKNEMLNDLKFYERMDKNYQKNEDWLATKADYESQFGKYESSSSSNKAYKNAFNEYKKKHPNSKLTLSKFIDMSEGK